MEEALWLVKKITMNISLVTLLLEEDGWADNKNSNYEIGEASGSNVTPWNEPALNNYGSTLR